MEDFKTYLDSALQESRYTKPKSSFPQSTKKYSTLNKAIKVGNSLLDDNAGITSNGTVAFAKLVKSNKYIVVWMSNKESTIDEIGGVFLDNGHSATNTSAIEEYETIGVEDWEQGNDYTLKWVA